MNFDPDFVEPSNVFASRLDATGSASGEPVQLTNETEATSGLHFASIELIATDGGYLAAWSEGDTNFETGMDAYYVVRVQRLSPELEPEGSAVLVDDKMIDIDQIEPSLVRWDEQTVALLWGRGTHIYICAGCTPDENVNLVLIDSRTLSPRSNVVELPAPAEVGGFLKRNVVRSDASLLMTLEITYHVHFEPGFAAFHCE